MKFNIKHISIFVCIIVITTIIVCGSSSALSDKNARKFSQNDIEFYDPDKCQEKSSSGTCGKTAKELYYSALKAKFGEVQAAAIMGNIMNEGDFNPVAVESCTGNNPFDFANGTWLSGWSWDIYFNDNSKVTGVGAFGTTSLRSEYLHYVEEKNSSLMEYFQHPETYSLGGCNGAPSAGSSETGGDALKGLIGDANFSELVTYDVEFLFRQLEYFEKQYTSNFFSVEKFKSYDNPGDAAIYFASHMERCAGCCPGCSDEDASKTSENQERKAAAEKAFDEFSNFQCSGGGNYHGKGYDLSDDELLRLINVALHENSCNDSAVKNMLSQMPNLYENKGMESRGISLPDYVKTAPGNGSIGWYAAYSHYYDPITDETRRFLDAAKDIIVNGNRTIPPQVYEFANGNTFEIDGGIGDDQARSRAGGIPLGTVVIDGSDRTGATKWFFWDWAGAPEGICGDPLGYTDPNNPPSNTASSSSSSNTASSTTDSNPSSSSKSSSPKPKVQIGDFTLIGDSIAVAASSELKEKFPNSYMSMVGSRHPTYSIRCNDETGGGLAVLKKIASGSGTIATEDTSGCGTLNIDATSLKDSVIWELGTNPTGATKETIEEVISEVGNKRKLYLVTPFTTDTTLDPNLPKSIDEIAQMYRDVAKEHTNVSVIDWNQSIRDDPEKYLSDGTHPTAEGIQRLVELISQGAASTQVCATNSKDPENFTVYTQCGSSWSDNEWGNTGRTICKCGCSMSGFAMIATALLGHEITPGDTEAEATNLGLISYCGGYTEDVLKLAKTKYGLETEMLDNLSESGSRSRDENQAIVDKVNQYLRDGWMMIVSGRGARPFTSGGHFIGIRGLTEEGKWLIADSALGEQTSFTPWEPIDIAADMHFGLGAIRSSGTTSDNCEEICDNDGESDSNGATGTGGFSSASEAEDIIKAYESDSLSNLELSTPATGDKHHNCVAFSLWFINHYTDISYNPGHTGNGDEFVDVFYSNLKGQYSDLTISGTPSVYSLASWGAPTPNTKTGQHTGIVIGLYKGSDGLDKILIAEAGWNNPEATGVHEYNLSSFINNSAFKYINLNSHLKSNTGLK